MNKRRLATTAVAAFGAAMTSMYAAPELNADIVDLTFTPGTNPYAGPGSAAAISIDIDQLGGGAGFSQWNDGIGKTMVLGNLSQARTVNTSSTLSANTFTGFGTGLAFDFSATGTAYVGFSFGGNVGWFSLNLGGAGGTITYLDGEYGSAGESVHVGGTTVIPEPTSLAALGILALGAAGVRRNRRK